jgi:hypothetical protein
LYEGAREPSGDALVVESHRFVEIGFTVEKVSGSSVGFASGKKGTEIVWLKPDGLGKILYG